MGQGVWHHEHAADKSWGMTCGRMCGEPVAVGSTACCFAKAAASDTGIARCWRMALSAPRRSFPYCSMVV